MAVMELDWLIQEFPGVSNPDAASSSYDVDVSDVLFSHVEEETSAYNGQRGVSDRDANEGTLALSPLYLFSNVGTQEEVLLLNMPDSEAEETSTFTPKRLLHSHKNLVLEAAKASYRIEGSIRTDQEHSSVPATAFASSFHSVGSALHVRQSETGRDLDIWRVARGYPMTIQAFKSPIRRMHVDILSKSHEFPDCPDMLDPLSNQLYVKTKWDSYLSKCDAGFWKRVLQQTFDVPKRAKMLHTFEEFLLPLSLKEEAACRPELEISRHPACAMVSYPVFSSIQKRLRSSGKQEQNALLKEYRSLYAEEIEKEVEAKAKECGLPLEEIKKAAALVEFRKSLAVKYYSKIRNVLSSTFEAYKDGDCVCSIGRILAMNDTMVATSVSSLPGSSGAALILLGLQVERMYFGIHVAPSASEGDHNIAIHTDNPSYVLGFFIDVINDLPLPDDRYWKTMGNDLRKDFFLRWLRSHGTLVSTHKVIICGEEEDWSKQQLAWLHAAYV